MTHPGAQLLAFSCICYFKSRENGTQRLGGSALPGGAVLSRPLTFVTSPHTPITGVAYILCFGIFSPPSLPTLFFLVWRPHGNGAQSATCCSWRWSCGSGTSHPPPRLPRAYLGQCVRQQEANSLPRGVARPEGRTDTGDMDRHVNFAGTLQGLGRWSTERGASVYVIKTGWCGRAEGGG